MRKWILYNGKQFLWEQTFTPWVCSPSLLKISHLFDTSKAFMLFTILNWELVWISSWSGRFISGSRANGRRANCFCTQLDRLLIRPITGTKKVMEDVQQSPKKQPKFTPHEIQGRDRLAWFQFCKTGGEWDQHQTYPSEHVAKSNDVPTYTATTCKFSQQEHFRHEHWAPQNS